MALTSGDYEAQANRLRSRVTRTVDELRSNLTPSKLAHLIRDGSFSRLTSVA